VKAKFFTLFRELGKVAEEKGFLEVAQLSAQREDVAAEIW